MSIATTIKLPCTARALEEAIRSFCEPHGCYDTALVKPELVKSIDGMIYDRVVLKIISEDNRK